VLAAVGLLALILQLRLAAVFNEQVFVRLHG